MRVCVVRTSTAASATKVCWTTQDGISIWAAAGSDHATEGVLSHLVEV